MEPLITYTLLGSAWKMEQSVDFDLHCYSENMSTLCVCWDLPSSVRNIGMELITKYLHTAVFLLFPTLLPATCTGLCTSLYMYNLLITFYGASGSAFHFWNIAAAPLGAQTRAARDCKTRRLSCTFSHPLPAWWRRCSRSGLYTYYWCIADGQHLQG